MDDEREPERRERTDAAQGSSLSPNSAAPADETVGLQVVVRFGQSVDAGALTVEVRTLAPGIRELSLDDLLDIVSAVEKLLRIQVGKLTLTDAEGTPLAESGPRSDYGRGSDDMISLEDWIGTKPAQQPRTVMPDATLAAGLVLGGIAKARRHPPVKPNATLSRRPQSAAVLPNHADVPAWAVEALREAESRTASATPEEMAGHLQDLFGLEITALMTGVNDPKTVESWISGQEPRPPSHDRLRDAFHITNLLEIAESRQTARSWFLGRNPDLGDRSPALILADDPADGSQRVMRAARSFLAHG